ncbi:MAG TPA: di-heme oxidoredictase family protein [Rhizomicrobium sp.]|nr:di-heme oxidoredictase family protein [Rhizomicrobium sp.]
MVPRLLIALALLVACSGAAPPPLVSNGARTFAGATGWALFRRPWISDPSSLVAGGGVGPLYDARACSSCHAGGGAGAVSQSALGNGMIVRVGRGDASGDAVYGHQLQALALPGFEPEADVAFHWRETNGLRAPALDIARYYYGAPADGTHLALRRAPSLFGIGLLDSIPDSEILSGRGKPAWIAGAGGTRALGRWGWKAAVPQLPSQVEIAFQRDFGIGTAGQPGAYGECTPAETLCRNAPGKDVELPDEFRDDIVAFLKMLRAPDAQNRASPGFAAFRSAGCMACHATPKGGNGKPVPAYTDLLLHDLGPGLDDGIAEGAAKSSEWRTAPLWDVSANLKQGGLLHDGRARSIAEAVRWHGGEASQARDAFNALSPNKRKLLEAFLLGH